MKLVVCLFFALLALHQDLWNWGRGDLLFGFLPSGLAYHAVNSMLCAGLGALAIHRIWPAGLEDEAAENPEK